MSTSRAAVSPLIVQMPSDGGQSMSTASYSGNSGSSARRSTYSRPVLESRCTSATATTRARPIARIIEVGSTPMNQALVDHLLKYSVKRGEFTLRSGKTSNWFIDAKQTTCSPEGMLLVADAVLAVLPDDITAIGGL